uniref:Uncharacterized protein n=1 Tax=Ciona intestinalis TaxID=7719 RepID=H2XWV2_CIOIN
FGNAISKRKHRYKKRSIVNIILRGKSSIGRLLYSSKCK